MEASTFTVPPGLDDYQPVDLVRVKRLHPLAVVPSFATAGSAGFDLALCEDVMIAPDRIVMGRTGLIIATPPGHMLMLVMRSSTAKRWGVKLANQVGIIDSDYCGEADEVLIQLMPLDLPGEIKLGRVIPAGTRIAQGVFVPVHTYVLFEEATEMGASRGGLGSTGV